MITMKEIADELGFSRWTISMIVNDAAGEKGISTATIRRVKDHMVKRGYVPSRQAVNLKIGDRNRLGILYSGSLYSHLIEAYSGITDLINDRPAGCENLIVPNERMLEGVQELLARGVSQLIWIHTLTWNRSFENRALLNYLENFKKVIIYNYHFEPKDNSALLARKKFHLVGIDRFEGYKAMANYLKNLGHRVAALPDYSILSEYFGDAWRSSFTDIGITVIPLKERSEWQLPSAENGERCARELNKIMEKEGITAACFLSDDFAAYTIKALQKLNVRVPEDMTVTGYDGMPFGEFMNPALTTLSVPVKKMTALVKKLLVKVNLRYRHKLALELIERESHGKPAI